MPKRTLATALAAALMTIGTPAFAQVSGGGGGSGGAAAPAPGTKPAKAKESNVALPKVLRDIAQCESGSDPTAVSADGNYRGKFMFTYDAWGTVGGKGDPAAASEAEQDRRALKLYKRDGVKPWPACGRQATA